MEGFFADPIQRAHHRDSPRAGANVSKRIATHAACHASHLLAMSLLMSLAQRRLWMSGSWCTKVDNRSTLNIGRHEPPNFTVDRKIRYPLARDRATTTKEDSTVLGVPAYS
jgi:hypothetical protein